MRTSITIRPAGMASAVTALAAATMLAACVASAGVPVPGPSEAQSLAAFRAGERGSASAATSEAQSLVQFRAGERAAVAPATTTAAPAAGSVASSLDSEYLRRIAQGWTAAAAPAAPAAGSVASSLDSEYLRRIAQGWTPAAVPAAPAAGEPAAGGTSGGAGSVGSQGRYVR